MHRGKQIYLSRKAAKLAKCNTIFSLAFFALLREIFKKFCNKNKVFESNSITFVAIIIGKYYDQRKNQAGDQDFE